MASTDERKPVTVLFADLEGSAEIRSWPEVGQTLLASGNLVEGRAFIERARATFEEIGAVGWFDQAQAALEGR